MCIPLGTFDSSAPQLLCTPKGDYLRKIMNGILFAHLMISFAKMIVINPFAAIGDLICCAVLYNGLETTNFCSLLIYMVFSLFGCVCLFSTIGLLI